MDRDQRIRDPVHDLIAFSHKRDEDCLLWELIQTPAVQRLRRIRQLGFSEFVYPGATHTRFSHVLGAMQMARRMLDAFERTRVLVEGDHHPGMRKATVSAALLHDIGHGAYSHVFEELASDFGLKKKHEAYTAELIETGEVASILTSAGIREKVLDFFRKEQDYNPYGSIISSQMDCDRLDFLCRDRYHTGIRASVIDLEWLFDSLNIEEVITDPVNGIKKFTFVVQPKGVSVVEEFVIAYSKMYQNVYFHKTTRAVQHLVTEMMQIAIREFGDSEGLKASPLCRFFLGKDEQSCHNYSALDDASVTSLIHVLADGSFGRASELASRYLRRELFKALVIPPLEEGGVRNELIYKFVEALREKNIWFRPDIIPGKSYKQYDVADDTFLQNIIVKRDGEFRSLHQVSDLVKSAAPRVTRFYFWNAEDRVQAVEVLRSVGA